MVKGLDDVETLQQKSEELKETTKDYKKNAHDLEVLTFWQHFKLWILLIGIIVLIIIVIIIAVSN